MRNVGSQVTGFLARTMKSVRGVARRFCFVLRRQSWTRRV